MRERTYYDVLGVPRNADNKQIKNAYREIAKEHHPDSSSGGDPERFHEAQQAYEVLGDETNRQQYDSELAGQDARRNATETAPDGSFFTEFGNAGFSGGGAPGSAERRGFGMFDPLFGSILEELFGIGGDPFNERFSEESGRSEGFGFGGTSRIHFGGGEPVKRSRGEQASAPLRLRVTLSPREVEQGVEAEVDIPLQSGCPRCSSFGSVFGGFCPICGGSGLVERNEPYTLEIPPGTPHGAQRSFRIEEGGLQTEVMVTVMHESRIR